MHPPPIFSVPEMRVDDNTAMHYIPAMFHFSLMSLFFGGVWSFASAFASPHLVRPLCSDLFTQGEHTVVNTLTREQRLEHIHRTSNGALSGDFIRERLPLVPNELIGILADIALMDSTRWRLRPFQLMSRVATESFQAGDDLLSFRRALLRIRRDVFGGGDETKTALSNLLLPVEFSVFEPEQGRRRRLQLLELNFESGLATFRWLTLAGEPGPLISAPIEVVLGWVPYSSFSSLSSEVWSELSPFLHYPSDSSPRWSDVREDRQSTYSLFTVRTGKPLGSLPVPVLRTLNELNLPTPAIPQGATPNTLNELAEQLQAQLDQAAFEAHGPTPAGGLIRAEHFAFSNGDLRHTVLMAPMLRRLGFKIEGEGLTLRIPSTSYINQRLVELSSNPLHSRPPNVQVRLDSVSYPGAIPVGLRLRHLVEGTWLLQNGTALQQSYRFRLLTPLLMPESVWNLVRAQGRALLSALHGLSLAPASAEREGLIERLEDEASQLFRAMDQSLPHLFALGLQTGRFPEYDGDTASGRALFQSRFASTLISLGTQSPRDRLRNAVPTETIESPALRDLVLGVLLRAPDLSYSEEELITHLESEAYRKQILNLF